MIQKLVDVLNLLNGVKCSGRDDLARMLSAMQKVEEVATELQKTGGVPNGNA